MDDLTQLLLTQVASGGGTPGLSLPDLVAQSMGDDPLAVPLVTALRQREASAAEDEDELDPETADVFERLYAEVENLRELKRTLADALGACRRCFGEDELCPVCHGLGRSGGRRPDPTLFIELVEPACQRHRLELAAEDEEYTGA
jgi:hypothetical protein